MKKILFVFPFIIFGSSLSSCNKSTYTVKFVNYDGKTISAIHDVKAGTVLEESQIPVAHYEEYKKHFDFTNWSGDVSKPITSNITFTAQYDAYVNLTFDATEDGFFESTQERTHIVKYAIGQMINYDEIEKPINRKSIPQYQYNFKDWLFESEKEDLPTTADYDYNFTADYDTEISKFNITFDAGKGVFENGKKSLTETVSYSDMPLDPTTFIGYGKPYYYENNKYYIFKGWDSEIVKVEGEKTYTAVYEEDTEHCAAIFSAIPDEKYQEDFAFPDGTTEKIFRVKKGGTPIAPADPFDKKGYYIFTNWDSAISPIEVNTTYKACYKFKFKMSFYVKFNASDENKTIGFKYYSSSPSSVKFCYDDENLTDSKSYTYSDNLSHDVYGLLSDSNFENLVMSNDCDKNGVEKVIIASDVKSIGRYAFMSCTNLNQFISSEYNTLEHVDHEAFNNCDNLTDIYIYQTNKILDDVYGSSFPYSCKIHVPKSMESQYAGHNLAKFFNVVYDL